MANWLNDDYSKYVKNKSNKNWLDDDYKNLVTNMKSENKNLSVSDMVGFDIEKKMADDLQLYKNKQQEDIHNQTIKQEQEDYNSLPFPLKIIDRIGAVGSKVLTGGSKYSEIPTTGNKALDMGTDLVGSIAGYGFNPTATEGSLLSATNKLGKMAVNSISKKVGNNIGGKLIKSGVEGAVTNAPLSALSSLVSQDNPDETLQQKSKRVAYDTLEGGLIGAGFGVGLRGLGEGISTGYKGIKSLSNKLNTNLDNTFSNPLKGIGDTSTIPQTIESPIANTSTQGTIKSQMNIFSDRPHKDIRKPWEKTKSEYVGKDYLQAHSDGKKVKTEDELIQKYIDLGFTPKYKDNNGYKVSLNDDAKIIGPDIVKNLHKNISNNLKYETAQKNIIKHKNIIEKAVNDGLKLPEEVLNDYPYLKKKYEQKWYNSSGGDNNVNNISNTSRTNDSSVGTRQETQNILSNNDYKENIQSKETLKNYNTISNAELSSKVNDHLKLTEETLPNDINQLQSIKSDVDEAQKRGMLKINLQQFAENIEKKIALVRQQNKELKLNMNRETLTNQYNNVADMPSTINQVVENYKKEPFNIKNTLSKGYTALVDRYHPIKQIDDSTHMMATISGGASNTTQHMLENEIINRSGNKISEAFKTPFKEMNKLNYKAMTPQGETTRIDSITGKSRPLTMEDVLNDYMLHQHNRSTNSKIDSVLKNDTITPDTVNKRIFKEDYTPQMSDKIIKDYEARYPKLKDITSRIRDNYSKIMQEWAVNGDILDQNLYSNMKDLHPDYVPKNRYFTELEKLDPKFNPSTGFMGKKKVTSKFTGSDREIINPITSMIGNIDRMVKAVRGNEVGKTLLDSIRNGTLKIKGSAEIVPTQKSTLDEINSIIDEHGVEGIGDYITSQFDKAISKKLKGSNIITVMEKGKPVQIKINDLDLLKSLRGLTESSTGTIEKIGRAITSPFKAVVTGYNPLFAAKNIVRDTPNAYINSITNNPAKFSVDLVRAAKEMKTNGELWREYKALGGEYSNFVNDGNKKLSKIKNQVVNGKSGLTKGVDFIKNINNSVESLNRFAEYIRTTEKGGRTYESKLQGLYNAGEVSTNFGRHGNVTKAIDSFVPYLNPAVQGLDKFARQATLQPGKTLVKSLTRTAIKGGLGVTAPTLILNAINSGNPDYEALDNRTKDTNYLIPKGDGTFIKLPKTRENGVIFGSLMERIGRLVNGEQNSFKGFGDTVATNFLPPTDTIVAPLNYLSKNKDFANRTIEPLYMQDRQKEDRYDDKTSSISKTIAPLTKYLAPLSDKLNISPKQLDYLIRSYSGIIGQVGLPATTDDPQMGKVLLGGFKADPLYNNQSVQDFYENKDKLKLTAGSKNFNEKIPSKIITNEEKFRNAFDRASVHIADLSKSINNTKDADKIKSLKKQQIDISTGMNKALDSNNLKLLTKTESKIVKLKK